MTYPPPRSALTTFLILTVLLTAGPWALMIYTGDIVGGDYGYVYALMWGPGLAALATVKLKKLDMRMLGFGWGKSRFALFGWLVPLGYALVAYIIIWTTGLGGFPNTESIEAIAGRLGWGFTDPAIFVPVYLVFIATTSMIAGTAAGLGEEIGWRGFMAPILVSRMGYTKAGFVGGVIWASWHFPIILFANYNSGTPVWYGLLCFVALVMGMSFIMQWLRLESGSVWPAAIMHASHNLLIQGVFTPLTAPRGEITAYAMDEFGFMLPIVIGILAFFLWTRRRHAVAAMEDRIARTGAP